MISIIIGIALAIVLSNITLAVIDKKSRSRADKDMANLFLRCVDWTQKKESEKESYLYGYHMGKVYNAAWYLRGRGLVRWIKVPTLDFANYRYKRGKLKAEPLPDEVILFLWPRKDAFMFSLGGGESYVFAMDRKLYEGCFDDPNNPEMTKQLAKEIKAKCK